MKHPTVILLPAWARRSVLLAASLAATAPAWAQLNKTGDLAFGSFVANSGGTVTVAPNGGRSKGGSVLLVAQGTSAAAAAFMFTGTGTTYTITLPANDTVTLTDGSHTMAVNNFTSSLSLTGPVTGSPQLLKVGATLTVGNAQAPGAYTGSFAVTVAYN